jgi:hypothetical protein
VHPCYLLDGCRFVVHRTKFVEGVSTVTRTIPHKEAGATGKENAPVKAASAAGGVPFGKVAAAGALRMAPSKLVAGKM